jgi:hypothetical protein
MSDQKNSPASRRAIIDPEMKKKYLEAKQRVAELEVKREAIERPFRRQMQAATNALIDAENETYEALENITDQMPDRLGRCESCGVDLFEGETGFKYSDDDIYACEACAPTFGELLTEGEEIGPDGHDGGEDDYAKAIAFFKSKPADQKCVRRL